MAMSKRLCAKVLVVSRKPDSVGLNALQFHIKCGLIDNSPKSCVIMHPLSYNSYNAGIDDKFCTVRYLY